MPFRFQSSVAIYEDTKYTIKQNLLGLAKILRCIKSICFNCYKSFKFKELYDDNIDTISARAINNWNSLSDQIVNIATLHHLNRSVSKCVSLKTQQILKSQVVYSKQPKLGLTQEFVVDCAHALWVVHSIKRLVSLMLLKWFLSDSFIYFMYRMFNEIF